MDDDSVASKVSETENIVGLEQPKNSDVKEANVNKDRLNTNKMYSLLLIIVVILIVGFAAFHFRSKLRPSTNRGNVSALSEPFAIKCEDAAPGFDLHDPEFDQLSYHVGWVDNPTLSSGRKIIAGSVNIAAVDQTSGKLILPPQVVANANPYSVGLQNNGAEWGNDASGSHLYFARITDDQTTTETAQVDKVGSTWQITKTFLSGTAVPIPTKNPSDTSNLLGIATVTFTKGNLGKPVYGNLLLTYANNPSAYWPAPEEAGDGTGRPIEGPQGTLIVFYYLESDSNGTMQRRPMLYDVTTKKAYKNLVPESDTRKRGLFTGFRAPELQGYVSPETPMGDVVVITTQVRPDRTGIDVDVSRYDSTSGKLVPWATIVSPDPNYPKLRSPEPFTFDGKMYLSIEASSASDSESIALVARVDPAAPALTRIVSPDSKGIMRKDPEFLKITPRHGEEEMVLYYTEVNSSTNARRMMMCHTGLKLTK